MTLFLFPWFQIFTILSYLNTLNLFPLLTLATFSFLISKFVIMVVTTSFIISSEISYVKIN
jgi:hypothetical protein